jgi:ribosomal protein S4
MATMSDEKKYLLERLPMRYSYRKGANKNEPVNIQKARKLIKDYEEKEEARDKDRQAEYSQDLTEAREAIYFKSPAKALTFIKNIEKKYNILKD